MHVLQKQFNSIVFFPRFGPLSPPPSEMDVLIRWDDGTKNVVLSDQLKFKPPLKPGQLVQMKWGKSWWRGRVLAIEDTQSKWNMHQGFPLIILSVKSVLWCIKISYYILKGGIPCFIGTIATTEDSEDDSGPDDSVPLSTLVGKTCKF